MARIIMPFLRSEKALLSVIIAIGLVLRLLVVILISHAPESDELAYLQMANYLIDGKTIVDNMGNYAMYNIGYPMFLLAPVFLIFDGSVFAAKLTHVLLGGLTIWLTYKVALQVGAGKVGRLLAAAAWSFYLPASIQCVYLYKENLMVPLMLALIWCALRLLHHRQMMLVIAMGIIIGLIALTGNAALSLLPVVVLAMLLSRYSGFQRILLSALMFFCAASVAAPWMVRNHQVIGAPVLNTNGGFNLYLGNNPAATGMFVSIADTPRASTWESLRSQGEVEASNTLRREAISWVLENPGTFLKLAGQKAWYFWSPPLHEGKGSVSQLESLTRKLWAVEFVLLLAFAAVALIFPSLRTKPLLLLWTGLVFYTAVHMVFYVIFRYREPIIPLVCVIAAMSLERLLDMLRRRQVGQRVSHASSE